MCKFSSIGETITNFLLWGKYSSILNLNDFIQYVCITKTRLIRNLQL